MTFSTKIRKLLASLTFAALVLGATMSFAEEAKVPTTAAEHEAMGKQYRDEATKYKKVAEDHRAMAAAYKTSNQNSSSVRRGEKPGWVSKMEKHCELLAKDADKLASDAEKAADYHDLRAKELHGK